MAELKLLNVGCGNCIHEKWVNIDFIPARQDVQQHDVTLGLPFEDNFYDAVYHSHLLEHLDRALARAFVKECYRVLKPGATIRVAVPDLEQIARLYLQNLEAALKGDPSAAANYEWLLLEMYDQAVRTSSGGEMAKYFQGDRVKNEEFVYSRIGREGRLIRHYYLASKKGGGEKTNPAKPVASWAARVFGGPFWRDQLKQLLFREEMARLKGVSEHAEVGKFRKGGEVHQWMYDRYSLGNMLSDAGFINVEVKSAFESSIPAWSSYELDAKDGIVHKPDSLFMEARKPA